jgi:hypothetical protein
MARHGFRFYAISTTDAPGTAFHNPGHRWLARRHAAVPTPIEHRIEVPILGMQVAFNRL